MEEKGNREAFHSEPSQYGQATLYRRYSPITPRENRGAAKNLPSRLTALAKERILSFTFPSGIPVNMPSAEFVEQLWNERSRCTDANDAIVRLLAERGICKAVGSSWSDIMPKKSSCTGLFEVWHRQQLSSSNIESTDPLSPIETGRLANNISAIVANGMVKKIWIISRSLSLEDRSLHALIEAERHYRTLVEQNDLVLVRISPIDSIVYISPTVEETFGYGVRDFFDDPNLIAKITHPNDRKKREALRAIRADFENITHEVEYRIRRADGSYRWIFERQAPRLDANGEVEYYDCIAFDITEKKMLEVELVHAQKMEVIGTLASGIAHDFNNHLTAILGQIGICLDELGAEHSCFPALAAAEKATLCCAEMSRQLLNLGKRESLERSAVVVEDCITDIVKLLKHVFPSNIDIRYRSSESDLCIYGNTAQLQQAIMNLAVNARDAMPSGGTLEISVDKINVPTLGQDRFLQASPGSYVRITVSDSGQGIPEHLLPHVFEPFFTTKDQDKGTGLGLSMVYSMIRAHQGFIDIASKENQGTIFYLLLPLCQKTPKEERKKASHSLYQGTGKILIGEDDEMVRAMAKTLLERVGYEVVIAKNGREALDFFT
ncbi:MAG: PAS domain-containing protein, partial [Bdellovibrionales bacterium]|nr:PAS domain-containing protein [Bdellovibrionales bacterium]